MGEDRMDENRFDDLIRKYASEHRLPWLLIKGQIWAESGFNPVAQSDHGAMGLMQLMPDTAREMGLDTHEIFDPEKNIEAGVKYDRVQYDHLPEIPRADERLQFMLAAYNCGRGYINQALRLARETEFGHQPKVLRPGEWQTWTYSKSFLAVPGCRVNGKGPDFWQVWNYVESIWKKYQQYRNQVDLVDEADKKTGIYPPGWTARNSNRK
jgi:SLT domain-containing protein